MKMCAQLQCTRIEIHDQSMHDQAASTGFGMDSSFVLWVRLEDAPNAVSGASLADAARLRLHAGTPAPRRRAP